MPRMAKRLARQSLGVPQLRSFNLIFRNPSNASTRGGTPRSRRVIPEVEEVGHGGVGRVSESRGVEGSLAVVL